MTVNLDHLDTPIPADGAPFEFRGQTFQLRKSTISDAFAEGDKQSDWENEDDIKAFVQRRMFNTKRDADRFWKLITTKYNDPNADDPRAPLNYNEMMSLIIAMGQISNGVYKDGEEDPKDGDS